MDSREQKLRVLVVDDDPAIRQATCYALGEAYELAEAGSVAEAWAAVEVGGPDLVLLDVMLPDGDGRDLCRRIKERPSSDCIVVLLSGKKHAADDVVEGLAGGADGYLRRPVQRQELHAHVGLQAKLLRARRELQLLNEQLETRITQATQQLASTNEQLQARIAQAEKSEAQLLVAYGEITTLKSQLEAENRYLRMQSDQQRGYGEVVGRSPAMTHVLEQIEQVADTESTVLLTGETGTGKELLAHAIHQRSRRRAKPMVTLDCASLPPALAESALFGHERGAFTHAVSQHAGRFELAEGSTLFLDEIGELPIELQAKLLRVLEERRFERVGGTKSLQANVRVIAATNVQLQQAVEEGRFRRDLYYRLDVFPIRVPALRERIDDVPPLALHFASGFAKRMGKQITELSEQSRERMLGYAWPGNVRELRNLVERAVIVARDSTLVVDVPTAPLETTPDRSLADWERHHIVDALEATGWRVRGEQGAAERLGLKPTTLESKMAKLAIRRPHRASK
jgi:formate hydrogenlyase transcriptional activator